MSSKNLKVYRTEFVTEVQHMNFKVKFPCQVKIVWKRSNESTETTLVPVENGVVHFNQTLKLNANMYFDPATNKFVEKKCIYNFLIVTEKGEKSAGSVTFDMGEFLNKRQYELEEEFPLQKCPLPDTKVKFKIYYNDSKEHGYDTMSQISAVDHSMDMSINNTDLSELGPEEEKRSQKQSETSKKQEETESNYDLLNESDLGGKESERDGGKETERGEKINENIKALNQISGKINDFVSRCSGNIRTEIETLKMKNKTLEESLSVEVFQKEKLEEEGRKRNEKLAQLEKEFSLFRTEKQAELKNYKHENEELSSKLEQSTKLCSQLESNMEEKGQSQASYISEVKLNFQKNEKKMKEKIEELNKEILEEKKERNNLEDRVKELERSVRELQGKNSELREKKQLLERKQENREKELQDLRYKLQNVFQSIQGSLGTILK